MTDDNADYYYYMQLNNFLYEWWGNSNDGVSFFWHNDYKWSLDYRKQEL